MSSQTVLIAALSGRALAASARRAGLRPLVVDAFGDADTRAAAAAARFLPEATRHGFRARTLLAALDELAAESPEEPIGLLLGSGFEDTPKLVDTLARRYRLLGNDGERIARAKDPLTFFLLLDALRIPHPETRLIPPPDSAGWLSKRIGGCGGAHVLAAGQPTAQRHGRYIQRRLTGTPASVLVVASDKTATLVGISRQWCVGTEPRPYRYGGAVGPVRLDPAIEQTMAQAALALCRALALVGLVSLDFVVSDGVAYLLEANPRPGATLDIFDDAQGSLFAAHLAAATGAPVTIPVGREIRAAAVLYAGSSAIRVPNIDWPPWSADRPLPETRIPPFRPLASVCASGTTPEDAEQSCRRRLDELAQMLYARTADREPKNAKIHRSRSERLGPGGQAR